MTHHISTSSMSLRACAVVLLFGAMSCQTETSSNASCEELLEVMSTCYPELAGAAECTPETLERYSAEELAASGCDAIDSAGKADVYAYGGCDDGLHVCGFIFCCEDDYDIHWSPSEADWDFVQLVNEFQGATPPDALDELALANHDDFLGTYSVVFEQALDDGLGGGIQTFAVEITMGIVEVPFEAFVTALPPEEWGISLDHYLGGQVQVYDRDDQGRAIRQLERMVLSPLPCNLETPLSNMDMTKVEQIVYLEDEVTVYWRVMYSDNGSTLSDVGSVSFRRHNQGETMVVFHSAHRLGTPLGTEVPTFLALPSLSDFFSDHVRYYRRLVVYGL